MSVTLTSCGTGILIEVDHVVDSRSFANLAKKLEGRSKSTL